MPFGQKPFGRHNIWSTKLWHHSGMGEIEKTMISNLENLKKNFFSGIEKSCIILVKISPFTMKKFEINEPIRHETFFQQSAFEMSCFDMV